MSSGLPGPWAPLATRALQPGRAAHLVGHRSLGLKQGLPKKGLEPGAKMRRGGDPPAWPLQGRQDSPSSQRGEEPPTVPCGRQASVTTGTEQSTRDLTPEPEPRRPRSDVELSLHREQPPRARIQHLRPEKHRDLGNRPGPPHTPEGLGSRKGCFPRALTAGLVSLAQGPWARRSARGPFPCGRRSPECP